jgi:hypothetical protein
VDHRAPDRPGPPRRRPADLPTGAGAPEPGLPAEGLVEALFDRLTGEGAIPQLALRPTPAEPGAPPTGPGPAPALTGAGAPPGPGRRIDVHAVADLVFEALERRQELERERAGG